MILSLPIRRFVSNPYDLCMAKFTGMLLQHMAWAADLFEQPTSMCMQYELWLRVRKLVNFSLHFTHCTVQYTVAA